MNRSSDCWQSSATALPCRPGDPSLDDILRSILVKTHRRSRERQAKALAGKNALDKLWALLLDNLPLDEERSVETLMEMTFWPRAVSSANSESSRTRPPTRCWPA